jgi:hypothetical protein
MIRPRTLAFAAGALFVAGSLYAQGHPLLDLAADKTIQKYQSSTCEQLWIARSQPKSDREKEIVRLLREDAQLRELFLNKVAAPIANKMFECAMIP